ncbi:glutamic acid-rich protein-like isoform X3 [Phyllopteryx taeniolatus]|uniref:glutamic acid-rich protein-like isoform X3 n=1 Tax=Phyllopteryx taeniolatus TaxID=161469 RepID=UPI002AD43AAD|nr:glutamic acid-rich protein-like isoform X3 [Phyllopteryx taeniolatus]
MCATSVKEEEYEEELCGTKEENDTQGQVPETLFKKPQYVLHSADISEEDCYTDHQDLERAHLKEEEEPATPYIKEEEEEADITEFPLTVIVKSEDEDDEEGDGGSQADSHLAPLYDNDDITSHSPDTDENDDDDDEHSKGPDLDLLGSTKKTSSTDSQSGCNVMSVVCMFLCICNR